MMDPAEAAAMTAPRRRKEVATIVFAEEEGSVKVRRERGDGTKVKRGGARMDMGLYKDLKRSGSKNVKLILVLT